VPLKSCRTTEAATSSIDRLQRRATVVGEQRFHFLPKRLSSGHNSASAAAHAAEGFVVTAP